MMKSNSITSAIEALSAGIIRFFNKLIKNGRSDGLNGIIHVLREYTSKSVPAKLDRFCEINLVPDVKAEMLKTQKLRNLALFILIIVCSISAGLAAVAGISTTAQSVIINSQTNKIKNLNDKIKSFSSLNDFLTVQGQLNKISELNDQKRSLSRVFSILSVLLAQSPDESGKRDRISISELSVSMDESSIGFEASAQALKEPKIDYRVLEGFKKSAQITNYDHGRYVTASGKKIPARCVEDVDKNGNILVEGNGIYGLWYKDEKGCDPDRVDGEVHTEEQKGGSSQDSNNSKTAAIIDDFLKKTDEKQPEQTNAPNPSQNRENSMIKEELSQTQQAPRYISVPQKIWRTPQFSAWALEKHMDDTGNISGIPHFESVCIKYSRIGGDESAKWQASNQCNLLNRPVEIIQSNNARNSSGSLVLRFTAKLSIDPAVFLHKNKHVIAIAPSGRNVTDSYTQVDSMFDARATDCKPNDPACKDDKNIGKDK